MEAWFVGNVAAGLLEAGLHRLEPLWILSGWSLDLRDAEIHFPAADKGERF